VANNENLKPVRTKNEARERGRNGGRRSGEVRRRNADFRKTLNALFSARLDDTEWAPFLEELGLEPTLEAAVNAAMIRKALAGDVKAYEAIAKYSGQSSRTEKDDEEQRIRTDRARAARDQEVGAEEENENIKSFLHALNPSQEDIESLFAEEVQAGGEETEETGEV
jgi:hypothetical protein